MGEPLCDAWAVLQPTHHHGDHGTVECLELFAGQANIYRPPLRNTAVVSYTPQTSNMITTFEIRKRKSNSLKRFGIVAPR